MTTSTPARRPFHLMAKPAGAACNLACSYCFYLSRWDGAKVCGMDDATLETYIREYIASQLGPDIPFAWQGGEPTLLGTAFFRRAVELQKKYLPKGWTVSNSIQTNGILLNDAWCQFLAAEKFLVGLSLDGPPKIHDCMRLDWGGNPTAERVLAAAERMFRHHVEFNILCVVGSHNAEQALQVYRFLRKRGTQFLQFIPLVERRHSGKAHDYAAPHSLDPNASLDPVSVSAQAWGRFLCTIFDEWIQSDVGTIFIRDLDNWLGLWMDLPSTLCVHAQTCGDAMIIETDGSVYSCDHFVYPEYRLGRLGENDLTQMASSANQRDFGLAKRDALPQSCLKCPWKKLCNGGCPKHRFPLAPGQDATPHLCAGWQMFFTHAAPAFNRMAELLKQQRPASDVMTDRNVLKALGLSR